MSSVFWLHPLFLLVCTLGLPALVTDYLSDEIFLTQWQCPKYFTAGDARLVFWLIGCFAAGSLCFLAFRHWLAHSGFRLSSTVGLVHHERQVRRAFWIAAVPCLVGSAVWSVYSVQQGVSLAEARDALSGNSAAVLSIRAKAETIPGITTLTQLGMAAATLAGLGWFHPRAKTMRLALIAIVLVALLRGFLRAERLAFIEVCVPFLISLLPELINRYRRSRVFQLTLVLAPFVAVTALAGYFILAESGRSYDAKAEEGIKVSPLEYGAMRFGGYYATSLNNGAYLEKNLPTGPLPQFSLEWFWRFPGVRAVIKSEEVTGVSSRTIVNLLTSDLNVEFNNPSGIFMYVHDFGRIGSIPVAFIVGIVAAALFFSYRNQSATGRLLFPMLVIGLLEISRFPYLTHSRAFPSVFFLLALVLLNKLARSRGEHGSRPAY